MQATQGSLWDKCNGLVPAQAGPRFLAISWIPAFAGRRGMPGPEKDKGPPSGGPDPARVFGRQLFPLDLDDFIGFRPAGRDDLHLRALFLTDQRAGERRCNGDPALLGVGLGLADDLPDRLLVGVLVDQGHRGAERDGVAGQFRDVDHLGAGELVLELGDVAFVERLRLFGGMIFGVLRKIAVGARVGDLLNDARPLDLLALPQLGLQRGIARRGHRNLVHRSRTSKAAESKLLSRAGTLSGRATKALSLPYCRPGRADPNCSSRPRNRSAARTLRGHP